MSLLRNYAGMLAVGLVVLVLVALVVTHGSPREHRFSVTVDQATNVISDQAIRQAGVKVGHVLSVKPADDGRAARLELAVFDRAWPLPRGTKLALRWGGTANFSNRYLALLPGAGGGSAVSEGGALPPRAFVQPVELDELLSAFDQATRKQLGRFLVNAGSAARQDRAGLRRTLRVAPPALEQASAVVQDLDADHYALRTLVESADDVVGAVQRAQPGVADLVQGAATTFDAVADETASVDAALREAPATLRTTRTTLHAADPVLDQARDVAARLRPGLAQAKAVAHPLDDLLRQVRAVGPDATDTLSTVRRASPDLRALLAEGGDLAPQLGSAGRQAVEALECIRPFTPDIVSFFTNWGDFISLTDGRDRVLRAQVQNLLPAGSNALPTTSGEAAKLFSGLRFGFPRPPGYNAGQPWFLPKCGAGPDALDPQKDPEASPAAKTFDLPSLTPMVSAPAEHRR